MHTSYALMSESTSFSFGVRFSSPHSMPTASSRQECKMAQIRKHCDFAHRPLVCYRTQLTAPDSRWRNERMLSELNN